MKKYIINTVLFCSLSVGALFGQLPSQSDLYLIAPGATNPAMVGGNSYANILWDLYSGPAVYAAFRNNNIAPNLSTTGQLLHFETGFTSKLKKKSNNVGLGFTIFNEQSHIFRRYGVTGSYAYHFHLGTFKNLSLDSTYNKFSIGLKFGFQNQSLDFSKASLKDKDDFLLLTNGGEWSQSALTYGVGFNWKINNFNWDFSYLFNQNPGILSSDLVGAGNYQMGIRYLLPISGYSKERLYLEPNAIIRNYNGYRLATDMFMKITLKTQGTFFWISPGMRLYTAADLNPDPRFMVAAGIVIHRHYMLSGSWLVNSTGAFGNQLGNTMELQLAYKFAREEKKIDDRLDEKIIKNNIIKNRILIDSLSNLRKEFSRRMEVDNSKLNKLNVEVQNVISKLDQLSKEMEALNRYWESSANSNKLLNQDYSSLLRRYDEIQAELRELRNKISILSRQ